MRFRIDLKIFFLIALFYLTKQIEIYAMIMFFAIIHELGHLLAGLLFGMKPEKMEIMPYRCFNCFSFETKGLQQESETGKSV